MDSKMENTREFTRRNPRKKDQAKLDVATQVWDKPSRG